MSVQAISWVLDNSESRLAARHVLISIANHCDKYGCNAFPSIATIASEAKLSERQVQRCMPELTQLGELGIDKGSGPGGTNLYNLSRMGGDKLSPHDALVEIGQNVTTGVTNQTKRGDKSGAAIRNNRPEPSFNQKLPPTPLAGGLTPRQLKDLSKELNRIYEAGVGVSGGTDFESRALQVACARLLLPLDLAQSALARAYGEQWWHGIGLD